MVERARIDAWRAERLARASSEPPADWLPVVLADAVVGIAHPDVASLLATEEPRCELIDYRLVFDPAATPDVAARTALLDDVARCLQAAGVVRGWRGEQLDVRPTDADPDSPALASIERAACRALGLTTDAVHLNAFAPDGRVWVARRAAHKAIDPGLLDNLVGGMVPAGESLRDALLREADEEAGLDLSAAPLVRGGRFHVRRRVPEGWQSERVQVFDLVLPADARPANRDGEVGAIMLWTLEEALAALARDEFTLESALVLLDALARDPRRHG